MGTPQFATASTSGAGQHHRGSHYMPYEPIYYVPPLRIVAPPGVPPCLPPSFDPLKAMASAATELHRHHSANGHGDGPATAATRAAPNGCAAPGAQNGSSHQTDPELPRKSTPSSDAFGDASPASKDKKRGRPSVDLKPKRKPHPTSSRSISSRKAVINTLRLYDALRRNMMLDEECKGKDNGKGSRPDLNAGSIINTQGLAVNRSAKVVGTVPGVEVGDQFYFRMEICCIGMHGPIQGGIEYLTSKESEYDTPVAISIISSGGYDARDDGEVLIYTGQGGKSGLDGKPTEDQKLERGNLAMEGSMRHQVPVRVIRGVKDASSPSGKAYTYDGLYKVEACWTEKGKLGFEEFKFKLRRLPGQPELGSALIKLSNSLRLNPSEREGLRLTDISCGREGIPVCVVNSVDAQHSPAAFEYCTSTRYATGINFQDFGYPKGCDCSGVCNPSLGCSCFNRNSNAFAYLSGGILVKERGVIHECGNNCRCSLSCRNRLSQRGLKYRFEIFKTQDRGWGLRSWDTIPAGSFIFEYTGRLISNAPSPINRDYVLSLSRSFGENNVPWGDVSSYLETPVTQVAHDVPRPELIIDSSQAGNASRFINHSCCPNVLVQCVLRDHQEIRCPHVALFAMDIIPPFKELTIDYGSEWPLSFQAQAKTCLCKSADCRGVFYQ